MHHTGHIASCLAPPVALLFSASMKAKDLLFSCVAKATPQIWPPATPPPHRPTLTPHLPVAHVCVWSWKALIVCLLFFPFGSRRCLHPTRIPLFFFFFFDLSYRIDQPQQLIWLEIYKVECVCACACCVYIYIYIFFTFDLFFIHCCWVNNVLSCFCLFFPSPFSVFRFS